MIEELVLLSSIFILHRGLLFVFEFLYHTRFLDELGVINEFVIEIIEILIDFVLLP